MTGLDQAHSFDGGLRVNFLLLHLLIYIDQSRLQDQPRFKVWRNVIHLLMGISSKSHCKTVEGKDLWPFLQWTAIINTSFMFLRFLQSHYRVRAKA